MKMEDGTDVSEVPGAVPVRVEVTWPGLPSGPIDLAVRAIIRKHGATLAGYGVSLIADPVRDTAIETKADKVVLIVGDLVAAGVKGEDISLFYSTNGDVDAGADE
jgi:hypothetical protein